MVEGGGSVHDFPLYIKGLALILQLPNISAQSSVVFILSFFKIFIIMLVPPFLECTTSEASVVLCTVLGGDTGNIYNFILLAILGWEGAVCGSPPTVAALDWLGVVLHQQLGVVGADQAAHVGHALV